MDNILYFFTIERKIKDNEFRIDILPQIILSVDLIVDRVNQSQNYLLDSILICNLHERCKNLLIHAICDLMSLIVLATHDFITLSECFRKTAHPDRGRTKCCRMNRLAGKKKKKRWN